MGIAGWVLALTAIAAPDVVAQTTQSRTASGPAHTSADVTFMRGMIGHHAQAIVMAAMAPTHGASDQVSLFCRKILRSQSDEIELMQSWLRERGERLPDPAETHAGMEMDMSTGDHAMLMPGMLSAAQLTQLDHARDREFDRLFLTFMMHHHEGALVMVATLFDSPGAGQTPEIFGYATGVDADQRAEIGRMQGMLATLGR